MTHEENNSPQVQAAVNMERRFAAVESKVDQLQLSINQLTQKIDQQNGRIGKAETAVSTVRQAHDSLESQIKERRGWERLSHVENELMEIRKQEIVDHTARQTLANVSIRYLSVIGAVVATAVVAATTLIQPLIEAMLR